MLLQPSPLEQWHISQNVGPLCGSHYDLVFLSDVCVSEETFGQEPCKKLFCLCLTLFIVADCNSTDSLGDKGGTSASSSGSQLCLFTAGPWKVPWNTDTFYTRGFPGYLAPRLLYHTSLERSAHNGLHQCISYQPHLFWSMLHSY